MAFAVLDFGEWANQHQVYYTIKGTADLLDVVLEKMKEHNYAEVKVKRGAIRDAFTPTLQLNECTIVEWITTHGWKLKHFASSASQGESPVFLVHTYMFEKKHGVAPQS